MTDELDAGELIIGADVSVGADGTVIMIPAPINFATLTDAEQAIVGAAIEKQIESESSQINDKYLRLGRSLYLVLKNRLYEKMGHATFNEWRAQPELKLERSTSYALLKVYETFVERLQVPTDKLSGLSWSGLYAVSRFVNPTNIDEYLEKVRLLSRTDLQAEVSMARAIASGQTPAQAAAQQSVIDTVRECCPIGQGGACGFINGKEDAAVVAFKKFLGGFRGLTLKIKSLHATLVSAPAQHEHEKSEVPPASSETVPSQPLGLSPDDLS
jgi:hypothetical protein